MPDGRPAVYTGNVKKHIVALVKRHGATGARNILNADADSGDPAEVALAGLRPAKTVPTPLGISMPTLLRFAGEAGVELKRGRPTKGQVSTETLAVEAA